ncbi:MAG: C40 family peptidase, partial [Actinomycetota bacterium]|nr:C40 family peptidase [Actinomycetota bacterium]
MSRRPFTKTAVFVAAALMTPALLVSSPAAVAATTPAAPPANAALGSLPAVGPAGIALPALPAVDRSITAGQDPAVLLARAIALVNADQKTAPLQTSVSSLRAGVDASMVRASQADEASVAAGARATQAAVAADQLHGSAASLNTALRKAALTLYMTGIPSLQPNLRGGSSDAVAAAVVGAQLALSPKGMLAARKRVAANADSAATAAKREQAVAAAAAIVANQALAAGAGQVTQLQQDLTTVGTGTAAVVQTEAATVSQQAGPSLSSPGALQFVPTTPLPPLVSTTTVALTWLFSELGKPYVWGATGPNTFDCSGLTQFIWAKAGITTPRVAVDQDRWAVPVPLSDLRAGDLVFFGNDIGHMGMYIGGGLMINAPHTGDVVRVSPIWWADLVGFGRVHT